MIRAMAESVDSDTLSATTWVFCVFSNFTTSNIAPTLFGRNTENCFTSGPSIFEVVPGRFEVIWIAAVRRNLHTRQPNYLIVGISLANLISWREGAKRRISRTHCDLAWRSALCALHSLSNMEEESELIALRRKKLETLRAKGVEPFGTSFDVTGSIAEVRDQFKEGETLRVAGRITAHRDMGKSHFLDLRDVTGRIRELYVHAKIRPEVKNTDIIGFIYREEVYKPDEEKLRGLADLILAKQRNGPTGNVKLVFLNQFTRFENRLGDFDSGGE